MRAAVLLLATVVSVRAGAAAWRYYGEWRTTVDDPSARDAYLTFFQVEIAKVVVTVALTVMLLRALRPATRSADRPPPDADAP